MDNSIGPSLPIGPFEKPSKGSGGNKKDVHSEELHSKAHEFSLELIKSRSPHSKTLQQLGVIMFIAESGVLPRDLAKQATGEIFKIQESFLYSSMKEYQINEELNQVIDQIKSSHPQAKIIAMVEELFYAIVKNPKEGVPPLDLPEFETIMKPIEEKIFDPKLSDLHISHIAKRLEQIQSDLEAHPRELGSHVVQLLRQLSQEVRDNF